LLLNAFNWAVANETNPPTLTGPANVAAAAGNTATFSVTPTGPAGPFGYQWYSNGVAIAGATFPDYTTPATTLANNGDQYQVVVSSLNGSVTSVVATLTVQTGLVITVQPQNQTNFLGLTATFNVTVTGTSPSYQWFSNNVVIAGANSSSYTTAPLTFANNGDIYKVTVTNLVTSVTSSNATVTVPKLGISSFSRIDSTHFSINWSNGSANSVLYSSTNLVPLSSGWIPIVTNPTLPYTITVSPNAPEQFFRVKQ
jgi:hypothetical protein